MQVGNVTFEIYADDLAIAFAGLIEAADQTFQNEACFQGFFSESYEIRTRLDFNQAARQLAKRLQLSGIKTSVPG